MPAASQTTVDAALARIAATPPESRRSVFFSLLAELDVLSRERIDLATYGRRMFRECFGPYSPPEWDLLVGVVQPRRPLSANESGRQADHSEAVAVAEERRQAWIAAATATKVAKRAASQIPRFTEEHHARYEAARVAALDAAAIESVARDAWDEALAHEVRLRLHQSEATASRGRDWLRWLRVRDRAGAR